MPKAASARPKRRASGTRNRLEIINKDPNKEYRLVNADAHRVKSLEMDGYVVEKIDAHMHSLGSRVDQGQKVDNTLYVGTGHQQVLMSIDKDLYQEYQEDKAVHVDQIEASMKPKTADGQYGSLEIFRK